MTLLAGVEEVLRREADADDVLRELVALLRGKLPGASYVSIDFVEGGELVHGPSAGEPGAATTSFPVAFRGGHVANLEVAGSLDEGERALLDQVAALLGPYCLVGWDTGGEEWRP